MGKKKIVDILLDQSLVSGIGFYLLTEILYYSKVHPLRIGNSLTKNELNAIRINSHKIMSLSYSYGGFTLKDFISPSGKRG